MKPTAAAGRPPMCVRMNRMNEKKKGQLRVCSGNLPIYCREWLGVCTWCRQFAVIMEAKFCFSEVKVGRKRTLRTGLGACGVLFFGSKLLQLIVVVSLVR
ncbi:hypothetical protein Nmel_007723 [Mimus melanotis]